MLQMGSLDKYCRLCALCVRPDHLVRLWEDGGEGGGAGGEGGASAGGVGGPGGEGGAGGEKGEHETPNCGKLRYTTIYKTSPLMGSTIQRVNILQA